MSTKEFIIVFIYDIFVLGIFGALAFAFNHWWIILFAALFITTPKYKHAYYRICDKCGKKSAPGDTETEALANANKAGWIHVVEGNKDYCPDCQDNIGRFSS